MNLDLPERAVAAGLRCNIGLAAVKIAAGIAGNAYALVADGVESLADAASSIAVLAGLRIAQHPPDAGHPYGHGKAEAIAAAIVALAILASALFLVVESVGEILTPHRLPAAWTLLVLAAVVAVKEAVHRRMRRAARASRSAAVFNDAWRHRADALTSAAAFIGILIARIGGPSYAQADDWAALLACAVIAYNGVGLLRTGLAALMDAAVSDETVAVIRKVAAAVPGVRGIEKCRARASGLEILMDIHVEVDSALTVAEGHLIAGAVRDALLGADLRIGDVVVHIEPAGG